MTSSCARPGWSLAGSLYERPATCGSGVLPQEISQSAVHLVGMSQAGVCPAPVPVRGLYALANRVQHPLNVNLREDAIIGQVDGWLAREFAPAPADRDGPRPGGRPAFRIVDACRR
jgi:hypothetical protein